MNNAITPISIISAALIVSGAGIMMTKDYLAQQESQQRSMTLLKKVSEISPDISTSCASVPIFNTWVGGKPDSAGLILQIKTITHWRISCKLRNNGMIPITLIPESVRYLTQKDSSEVEHNVRDGVKTMSVSLDASKAKFLSDSNKIEVPKNAETTVIFTVESKLLKFSESEGEAIEDVILQFIAREPTVLWKKLGVENVSPAIVASIKIPPLELVERKKVKPPVGYKWSPPVSPFPPTPPSIIGSQTQNRQPSSAVPPAPPRIGK